MNLTLCLTRQCNLRCGYCYAGKKQSAAMPWSIAKSAIDFGIEKTVESAVRQKSTPTLTLGFFGGEPLLEWELLLRCHEYCTQEAQKHGVSMSYTLTTNMTLLDKLKYEWLKKNNYHLGLSLDGNETMHHTYRRYAGGASSHADCVKALQLFEPHDTSAEIIMVLDPKNIDHLTESVKWLADTTSLQIMYNPNFSADWTPEARQKLRVQYEQTADFYKKRFKEGKPIYINIFNGKIRTHLIDGYKDCHKCGFGEKEIAVSTKGNFYPCDRLVGDDIQEEICFGNVHSGYDEAKRIKLILGRGNHNENCKECSLKHRCMNWCGCINYVTSQGDYGRVGEFTCFHEQLSIEVADSIAAELWAEENPAFIKTFYNEIASSLYTSE